MTQKNGKGYNADEKNMGIVKYPVMVSCIVKQ